MGLIMRFACISTRHLFYLIIPQSGIQKNNRNGKTKTRKTNKDKEGSERERKIMDKQGFLEKQEEVNYVDEEERKKEGKTKKWYERKKRRKKKNKNVNSSRQLV